MIELTDVPRQELAADEPIAVDPMTKTEYVLVRKEIYERLKGILDDEDARLMYLQLAKLDPEDWEEASHYQGKP